MHKLNEQNYLDTFITVTNAITNMEGTVLEKFQEVCGSLWQGVIKPANVSG